MNEESLCPERDELWAKHDGLTPKCCAEMIALAGKLEQDRNVWKHNAGVVAAELESEHQKAIEWFLECQKLKAAIYKTIMENLHLADGDVCTLKELKDAISFELPPENAIGEPAAGSPTH